MDDKEHGENLFSAEINRQLRKDAPLARRTAPRTLDEIIGQDHVLGPGKILRRAIEADRITSLILYGPPGCGKTALARVIAMRTRMAFERLNATMHGVRELRKVTDTARERKAMGGQKTMLFLDEIHRFSRSQQDSLLPSVENGIITLIGATTENPFFSIIAPLLSRSQIFEFRRIEDDGIILLLQRALEHPEAQMDGITFSADVEALGHIALYAEGDGRRALNALEIALLTTEPVDGVLHITLDVARESIQRKMLHYDGMGDEHYDAASAFIKSMRGTDPDSALYWMARMIESGEPPRFVARRICICAAEDVGNADPMALVIANAALQASEVIGMPEARILLAQAATYVACAPKSNAAYMGIDAALADVRAKKTVAVPVHLQDSHYKGAERLGRGGEYKYAHEHEDAYVPQDYGVPRWTYYVPNNRGKEIEFLERLKAFEQRDKAENRREAE